MIRLKNRIGKCLLLAASIVVNALRSYAEADVVKVYPAPTGEQLSNVYKVSVNGKVSPVYNARIGAAEKERRFKAVDDLLNSEKYYDVAAFTYFDMAGKATVTVTVSKTVKSVKVLPSSAGIKATISGQSVSFSITKPQNLTVEINGEWVKSLHVFANAVEENAPRQSSTNLIYYGPGIHDVTGTVVGDNKTVYIAGGAILRCRPGVNEKYGTEPSGLKNYDPRFWLRGRNITLRGRGIIDASAMPTHGGNLITISGSNIKVEGVIIRNSCGWTIPIRQSENVTISNVKILGYRANSDGIDICNSRNITIDGCFVRTNDDLIVIKSWEGQGDSRHIIVKNCVLWNQLAHALSLGAELREPVEDVLFTNCDVIHDIGRAWTLRIFHSDASTVRNVRFENLRIEESHQFINLWIGKDIASYNTRRGTVEQVVFKNVTAKGAPLNIDLLGASEKNAINNVLFENVRINGRPLIRNDVKNNPFVYRIAIAP